MYRNRRGTFDGGNFAVHLNFDGSVPAGFSKAVDPALGVASLYIETTVIPEIHDCNRRPVLVQRDRIPFREETSITGPGYFGKLTLVVNASVDTMYADDIEEVLRLTVVQAGAEVNSQFAAAYAEDLEAKRQRRQFERMLGPLMGLGRNGHSSEGLGALFIRT